MPGARYSIEYGHPAREVFAVLADFSNDPRWRANVLEMIPQGNPGDLGGIWSRQVEVRQVPGQKIRTEAVITAFGQDRTISVRRASGPVRPEATYTLTDLGQRTRVDFKLEVKLEGAKVLLTPLVALLLAVVVSPVLPGDFRRLGSYLDSRPSG